ncbi:MAG: hypothetical protein ACI8QY_000275, partial [bacterium]
NVVHVVLSRYQYEPYIPKPFICCLYSYVIWQKECQANARHSI